MTKKDFTFPFFYKEWLVSTTGWDADARGWYINLLCHQADKKVLPPDAESLAELAGVKFSQFERFKIVLEATLKAKFKANEQGMLENKVMSELISEREQFVNKRAHSGVVGALIKKGKELHPELGFKAWKSITDALMEFDFTSLSISKKEDLLKATIQANIEANSKPLFIDSESDSNSIDKQLNNKTNKPKEGLIFPFESEEFKTAWGNWVVYKKGEYNFKYKTLQSEQGALMKLSELSKNENEAIKIIHESIANGWKGFFKLKNENNDKTNNSQGIYSEEFKQRIARGMVT